MAQSAPTCDSEVYDVQNVVTHEVGHFFGLGEDMDDTSATMYVCTNRCETHKRVLSETDKAVVSTLYAGAAEDDPAQAAPPSAASCSAHPSTRTNDAGQAAWALFGALLLVARRRR